MQKISLQKRSFFNSIGLDLNNIPTELQIKSNSIQTKISKEYLKFLNKRDLIIPREKYFRIKNLFGTDSIKLDNKTWIEIFSNSEKTDDIVKLYFKNPNYYYKELKKLNQSELKHQPIELYEVDGKFFIKDGIARLSLVLIKYLLEMSRAQSKEEKEMINKQYIFAGIVRSTPKDRDIVYLINMMYDIYGKRIRFQKLDNNNECSYIMKLDDRKFEISSKKELENFIRSNYLPKEYKSTDSLKARLKNILRVGLEYKDDEEILEQFLVMGKIFPNYEIFVKYYNKLCKYGIEDKLYEKLDLKNVTYDIIVKKLIKIVKQEEINMSKLEIKGGKATEEKKTSKSVVSKKEPTEKEEPKKVSAKRTKTTKATSKKATKEELVETKEDLVKSQVSEVEETVSVDSDDKINKVKKSVENQISSILENIEMTYYKLKTNESKLMDLSSSTNVELNLDKMNDDSINSNINSIKENSFVLKNKIAKTDNIDNLNYMKDFLGDLKLLSNDKSIVSDFSEEMENIYTMCFNKNAQKLITDSKLRKLDRQRKEIESEKCSFFSKLIGKAKLKQARLDNINLKEQLILTESQFTGSSYTTIEDGLSDIYAYVKTEEDQSSLFDVKTYLKNIESNAQIKGMINQNKLAEKTKEKVEKQRNLPQLILGKEKKNFFSKAQINMVQEKNNELKRVIQINRANSLKLQNTGVIPIVGTIKSTRAVKKFISNLGQIDTSIKSQND